MKSNVGGWDRFLRFAIGAVILIVGYVYNNYWGLLGLVPIITASARWCPLYIPFKFSTHKGCCNVSGSCCCNKK